MPSRPRGHGRAPTRLAGVLMAVALLTTGCAGGEPTPVATKAAPSPPSAEELAAEATVQATASAEAADAALTSVPGVVDATLRIGQATAEQPLPAIALVTFAGGTPVDQLRRGVATIVDVLGSSGLALDHVELLVGGGLEIDQATWTGAAVGPALAPEAQLWVDLIEQSAAAWSVTVTHEDLDPLSINALSGGSYEAALTSSAVYRGIVDACVQAGIDPAVTEIQAFTTVQVSSRRSTPIPTALLTAAEQVDILDYVYLGSVTRADNLTEVFWLGAQGSTITASQQLALLGPLERDGLLTDDLTVTLFTDAGESITVWPTAPPA